MHWCRLQAWFCVNGWSCTWAVLTVPRSAFTSLVLNCLPCPNLHSAIWLASLPFWPLGSGFSTCDPASFLGLHTWHPFSNYSLVLPFPMRVQISLLALFPSSISSGFNISFLIWGCLWTVSVSTLSAEPRHVMKKQTQNQKLMVYWRR